MSALVAVRAGPDTCQVQHLISLLFPPWPSSCSFCALLVLRNSAKRVISAERYLFKSSVQLLTSSYLNWRRVISCSLPRKLNMSCITWYTSKTGSIIKHPVSLRIRRVAALAAMSNSFNASILKLIKLTPHFFPDDCHWFQKVDSSSATPWSCL